MSPRRHGMRALRTLRIALLGVVALFGAAMLLAQDAPDGDHAVVLKVQDAISPASSDYILRNIDAAAQDGARLVVLELDTPGGLDTSMRQIVSAIVNAPIPVATYVSPSGSRAASAGTYILYASHVAAMAPATHLGAATPVAIGGSPGGNGDDDDSDMPFSLQAENPDTAQDTAADNGAETPDAGNDTAANDDATQEAEDAARETAEESAPPRDPSATEAKAINDAVAYIRGLADLRDRNADWAEKAVRDAATLTATDAEAEGVIDFVARDAADLLERADGMVVDLGGEEVTLETAGLAVVTVEPDWRTAFLSVITNPNVALLLMLAGFYGLVFEFLNPGVLVPGTIGGISLILGLYSLALLPLNFAGAALILLGLALMVAEAFAPSFGVLGIGGTVAIVLGATIMFDTDAPGMDISIPLIAGIALTGLALTLIVARLAMRSFRAGVVSGPEELAGMTGEVLDWDGRRGHVWLHGERWQARAEVPADLSRGDQVRVTGLDNLTLDVAPQDRD